MVELEKLRGVLVALVSPLKQDGKADEAAIDRLVNHVMSGGLHGVLALGSTGEGASLDAATRLVILNRVVEAVAGRVPVICGVAQSHLSGAIAEVELAADLGVTAALVVPPFYYPMEQAALIDFYRQLARQSPVPILLYNIPQFTKVRAEPATVAALARDGTIAGIKDSSRDFEYFEGVCVATRDVPKFRLFTGSDTMLLASLLMGGAGTICGAANISPEWVVRIYKAFHRGDMAAARDAQDALYRLVMALRGDVVPAAIKAALHIQGVCEPWLAPPAHALDESRMARLRDEMQALGLLTAGAGKSAG